MAKEPKSKKTKNVPVKVEKTEVSSVSEYAETLAQIKQNIQEAQIKASFAVNKELIKLYWNIGKTIVEKQENSGWGSKVIEKLAHDLQNEFPGLEGFSRTNVFRMRSFYQKYKLVPPAVGQFNDIEHIGILAQIPWSHNVVLMEKLDSIEERKWYAQKTLEHGWSRNTLSTWVDSDLHKREGKAITNFKNTLPAPQSDLAQQTLKDPYLFDFLTLHKDHLEKDLEEGLMNHMQKFLLELGQGFAFLGRQYSLVVDGEQFYIDLLFYHVILRRYFVIEIKSRPFKPEDTGQLNFYLSAVDALLKRPDEDPTIGILLCKKRNKVVAEYALRGILKPMGVVEYETMLTKALPKELKSSLPTIQEIEAELGGE